MIYAINLVVDTKITDIYDKVSLNKYPMVVFCNDTHELKDILSNDDTKKYIQQYIKSQKVFDSAQWYIRSVDYDDALEEVWDVSDLINISY
jgi:signal recognition particle receptor subunit beta